MDYINLTPHSITLRSAQGDHVIPPSGRVARVATQETLANPILAPGSADTIPVVVRTFGAVQDLPDPAPNTVYLVSSLVLSALAGSGRTDVLAPDTGPTAVRDDQGRIIAVTRLVAPSP